MYSRIIITASAVIIGAGLFLPTVMQAEADSYGIDKTAGAINSGKEGEILPKTVAGASTVPQVIGAVVGVLLSLVGLVFFGLMLYAGFRWMIAMGNTEDVEKARTTLEAAVIGLVIVLAAYAITSFVFSNLGSKDTVTSAPAPASGPEFGPAKPTCDDLSGTCSLAACDPNTEVDLSPQLDGSCSNAGPAFCCKNK